MMRKFISSMMPTKYKGFQLVPLKLDCPAHLIKAFLGAAIGKRMWKFLQFTNSASKLDFKIRFL